MSLEFRLDNNCPNDWNQNLLKSEFGNIYNTYEYSQYAKSRLDWIPSFLSIIDSNGNIISQTVLFDVKNKKGWADDKRQMILFLQRLFHLFYFPVLFQFVYLKGTLLK